MLSMIQSNFSNAGNGPGNLELVQNMGGTLYFFWRDDNAPFVWHGGPPNYSVVSGITGSPSLIQGRFGQRGHFELVVPLVTGGLVHYYRDNDTKDANGHLTLQWHRTAIFGQDKGVFDEVALVHGKFGASANYPGGAIPCFRSRCATRGGA